jgi:hypothetical protein
MMISQPEIPRLSLANAEGGILHVIYHMVSIEKKKRLDGIR